MFFIRFLCFLCSLSMCVVLFDVLNNHDFYRHLRFGIRISELLGWITSGSFISWIVVRMIGR